MDLCFCSPKRHQKNRSIWSIFLIALAGLFVVSCENSLPLPDRATPPGPGITPPPATYTPQPAPTASPTPVIPMALLLATEGADPGLLESASQALSNVSAREGIRWQIKHSLAVADLTPEVRLVIAFPPAPNLEELARSAPQVQFLAVGIAGLPSLPNLSQIGPEGSQPEKAAFLGGIIAAILTDEWRVAVISLSDTSEGVAARQAFLNGVVFFCGLCRQVNPPYYQYPLYVEFPASASQAEKLAAATTLVDYFVKVVYLYPGAADPALITALGEAGILMIGGASPGETLPTGWAATVRSNPASSIEELLPGLLEGKGGGLLPVPLEIADVNPQLFSPGRQALAEKYLAEIQEGVILIQSAP